MLSEPGHAEAIPVISQRGYKFQKEHVSLAVSHANQRAIEELFKLTNSDIRADARTQILSSFMSLARKMGSKKSKPAGFSDVEFVGIEEATSKASDVTILFLPNESREMLDRYLKLCDRYQLPGFGKHNKQVADALISGDPVLPDEVVLYAQEDEPSDPLSVDDLSCEGF